MIKDKFIYRTICLFLFLSVCFVSCSDDDNSGNNSSATGQATWKDDSTVTSDSGVATLLINGTAGSNWTAAITEGSDWCSFKYGDYSGSGLTTSGTISTGVNVIYVYYAKNSTSEKRTGSIEVTFGEEGEAQTLQLSQVGYGESVLSTYGKWAETPTYQDNSNYLYLTHYIKDPNSSKQIRNYSFCYDKTKRAALWVAYPLHAVYLGSGGRTEAWSYDPDVDTSYQPNLTGGYGTGYDRGHQLPSADRTATTEMNQQTFYFTNMTPQLSKLNQQMWANLESKVRGYSCSDTLYVVTGAYFANTSTTTTDKGGNKVPVPTHYFKVLLRTVKGNTGKSVTDCTADELKSIGFWVEQKNYGNVQPSSSLCVSVADIEAKTGFTFFPNVAETVKSECNPSEWNIN